MNTLSVLLMGLVMFFWGSSVIFDKLGLKKISAIEVLFWASLAPFVGALALIISKGKLSFSEPKNILWSLLAGLLGFLGLLVFFILLKKYPASQVTPIVALYPVITVVLGIIFFSEKLLWYQILGLIFALAGVFLLTK